MLQTEKQRMCIWSRIFIRSKQVVNTRTLLETQPGKHSYLLLNDFLDDGDSLHWEFNLQDRNCFGEMPASWKIKTFRGKCNFIGDWSYSLLYESISDPMNQSKRQKINLPSKYDVSVCNRFNPGLIKYYNGSEYSFIFLFLHTGD